MKINKYGLATVIIATIYLIIPITVLFDVTHIVGYKIFNGTINNITTTTYKCLPCVKMDNRNNCILYEYTTCYNNTIYAIDNHITCSLTKRIKNNQQQFILDTPIGKQVKWYKHLCNHKCTEDISDIVTITTFIFRFIMCILIIVICQGCVEMFDTKN